MRRGYFAGLVLAAALLGGLVWFFVPRHDIMPQDDSSARLALRQALKRKGLRAEDKRIVPLTMTNTFLAGVRAFGVRNPTYELLGGPRYERIYLVGPVVAPSREVGLGSFSVTANHVQALLHLLSRRAPKSSSEALEVAQCAAWLLAGTRPEKLDVLGAGEVPSKLQGFLAPDIARSLAQEISAPAVQMRQTFYLSSRAASVHTVEFCTYLPECWGDIVFWHMEIGDRSFSVSRRTVYLAPRVLE
jgi:hypothetical protein